MSLNPLEQLSALAVVATIVVFLVTWWLLHRWCVSPLVAVMERREQRHESARRRLAAAQDQLRATRAQAEAIASAAATEAQRIEAEAATAAAVFRREQLAIATKEAEVILEQGRDMVRLLRQATEARLVGEVVRCASETLSGLAGPVQDAEVRYITERLVADDVHG